jgi:methionine sulfoxide reductase heme-binding subunit
MRGQRLLLEIAASVAALCAWIVLTSDGDRDATAHTVVRWTARTSLVMFVFVYVARPAQQLWRTPLTKYLLAERKWIGLGFATSHLAHLIGILVIASADFGAFLRAQPPTNAIAALTFLLLFAMAITSIESVKRKMSSTAWKRLHRAGIHFAWISFAGTYSAAIAAHPAYLVPTAILWSIAGIRFAAWLRQRRRAAEQATPRETARAA